VDEIEFGRCILEGRLEMIDQLQTLISDIEYGWADKRLLVIGDVMLDRYIWGEVGRISPEAPVPVVRTTRQTDRPGGAANVAMNIASLGAQTTLVGFTGGDTEEQLLTKALGDCAIRSEFVVADGFPTTTKVRILGGKQQMLRLDNERVGLRKNAEYDRLISVAFQEIPLCQTVVLSDYGKGTLTPEVCQKIITAAREAGVPVLVDPKSTDFTRYRGATTICPNLHELTAAVRTDNTELETLLRAAQAMVSDLNLEFMTVTLSERGIAVVWKSGQLIAPAVARQVFDVSGAGDTVIATLALCLSSKINAESAVELANMAAGIVVGKVGTVPVEKHELLSALSPQIALHPENKTLTWPDLKSRVSLWKMAGEHVVFTNGCFDLLHVGHITLLERARLLGDRLVVGVNSDSSVRALKGPTRPVVGENERVRVLAALASVDAAVIFDQATPLELIQSIQPDVIVKGGDYTPDTVVGAREVSIWGGRVEIVPIVQGFSTTSLIEKGFRKSS
jgi:D-beta-D-heptose 7-phosphate kinase/D-beta-D-heptose 1-phosphate adenosyltransferase